MEGHSPCEHRALSEAQRGLARVPLPLRRRALPGNGEPRPARFPRGAAAPGRRQGGRAGRCPGGSGGEAQHPRPRGCCSQPARQAPRARPGGAGAFHPRPSVRVGRRARPPRRGPGLRPWAGVRGGKTKPPGSPAPLWQSPMPRCFHLFLICLIKRLLMALTIVLV